MAETRLLAIGDPSDSRTVARAFPRFPLFPWPIRLPSLSPAFFCFLHFRVQPAREDFKQLSRPPAPVPVIHTRPAGGIESPGNKKGFTRLTQDNVVRLCRSPASPCHRPHAHFAEFGTDHLRLARPLRLQERARHRAPPRVIAVIVVALVACRCR